MLSPEGIEENRVRKIPSAKMLLERVGLAPSCLRDSSTGSKAPLYMYKSVESKLKV